MSKKKKKKNSGKKQNAGAGKKPPAEVINATAASAEEAESAPETDSTASDPSEDGAEKTAEETKEAVAANEPEPEAEPEPEPEDDSYDAVLSRLTPDDIKDGGYTSSPLKKGGVFSLILYFIFIGVFIVTSVLLVQNIYSKYRSGQIYDEIADAFEDGGGERTPYSIPGATLTLDELIKKGGSSSQTGSGELAKIRASLASLSQTNPDTYGWITIPGTNVNYPVVRGSDNDWYLDHAYTGDTLPAGSIFADFRTADSVFDNANLILYGHNATNGAMFGSLSDRFLDREFFDECRIYLYTPEGIFVFRPFSVHEPAEDSDFIKTRFSDTDDYLTFLKWLADDSMIKAEDFTPDGNVRVLTLSTCTDVSPGLRFAVHAALESYVTD